MLNILFDEKLTEKKQRVHLFSEIMSHQAQNHHLRVFNRLIVAGEYFEAHEAMEEVWIAEGRPAGDLWQGLTQLAVALAHADRGNRRGARRVFAKARDKLSEAERRDERIKAVVDLACGRYEALMSDGDSLARGAPDAG